MLHSSAAVISASDLPACYALAINTLVKSAAGKSSSPAYTSTPSLLAIDCTYPRFRILPMFDRVLCTSAKAPKFGILASSSCIFCYLFSVAAIPSSIAFWAASIFAFASSTVSK